MENLECFWDSIREFLNVMVGFRVGTVPDPIATAMEAIFKGERVEITNPLGYAECVIEAMSRVVPEELPNDQGSLFHSARWHFERFCDRYGNRSADGDLQWIGPPEADDPHALALKELATGRIPSPARSLAPTAPPEPPAPSGIEAPLDEYPDLVTLDQAAALVHKSKRTLERCKTKGKLPSPAVEGGGGRADLYAWETMGPWLEATFGIRQPTRPPAARRG